MTADQRRECPGCDDGTLMVPRPPGQSERFTCPECGAQCYAPGPKADESGNPYRGPSRSEASRTGQGSVRSMHPSQAAFRKRGWP
jgi:hypothetical protein